MNKYKIVRTSKFKKDLKTVKKRGCDLNLLEAVVDKLAAGEKLDDKYNDHNLVGNWAGYRECHIEPDWLLIYRIVKDELELHLTRTGTHGDLFNM